jgi:hypothetical protein
MTRTIWANIAVCSLAAGMVAMCLTRGLYVTALGFGLAGLVALANNWFVVHWAGLAYRVGWLSGRTALFESMSEAMRRKMTMPEWLEAEFERDGMEFLHFEFEED